ncbi:Peptidase M16 inactive domain protein [Pseudobythopirellula maris]|uniref:Peptidase M16 inactive domain protein n=1 Tax=Pseudobythopirellula maris TaxID=2527991 RepID=A0A5C5ZR03_9BACT|nr:pitrilysin family protein [Pseudobythopirellula maris]TWT89982.1 Peptidase M16 inactive domain protein [Pseudobythopirellula maris]
MSDAAQTFVLPNGMVLVGEPVASFASASFTLLAPAGGCWDPVDRLGLASLTCEMLLRGAGSRDSRAFVNDLERLGVERHESVGVSNASFSASMLAENLPAALEIYADLMRRPLMPSDQLDAGRQVCLQELRGVEDEPSHKLMNELRRRHYPDPWGRSSQGDREGLEATTADEIARFYVERYGPRGMVLAVAGAFDWPELCKTVERLFGDWASQPEAKPVEGSPLAAGGHVPFDSSQSHIGLAYPSVPYRHEDYFQAWAAVGVLSGGMSSRLFTEVREKRGLCYTVNAALQTQVDRAAVFCYAGTTAERAQETLDVTMAEILKLAEGVRPDELARLKARIKSGLIMQQESTSARSSSLARDWRHLGRVRPVEELSAMVDAITSDSINAYLRRDPPSDFTCVTLGPKALELPAIAGAT